jgi:hypothetical protein
MKKWRKRILWGIGVGLLGLVAAGGVMFYLSTHSPDWYRAKKLSPQAVADLRKTAENKLSGMQSWVQGSAQWPKVGTRPPVATDPEVAPPTTKTITLTEDELNAMLGTWEEKLLQRFGQYISDPALGLRDGHVVLAVTLKDAGRVLSVHVQPRLDDQGMLILSIDELKAGRMTVPKMLWSSYTDKVAELLGPKVEESRTTARLEADGTGNEAAVASLMNRLLLRSLKDKSADPVLFLPPDPSHLERGYPVKVADVKIENESLTLTLVTLTGDEQKHLLARIRAPFGEEPPPVIGAPAPVAAAGAPAGK